MCRYYELSKLSSNGWSPGTAGTGIVQLASHCVHSGITHCWTLVQDLQLVVDTEVHSFQLPATTFQKLFLFENFATMCHDCQSSGLLLPRWCTQWKDIFLTVSANSFSCFTRNLLIDPSGSGSFIFSFMWEIQNIPSVSFCTPYFQKGFNFCHKQDCWLNCRDSQKSLELFMEDFRWR